MKNLYKITLLLFALGASAQNDLQNANWIFGDNAWLDFNNNTVTQQTFLLPLSTFNREGVASVSDMQGNIVFWTDGQNVFGWNGTTQFTYTNGTGLFGDDSSSQNVVIIPKPNHPGIFYIATITGYTTIQPGSHTGLYYSEVNTLTRTVSPTIRNIPLNDINGTPIDDSYGNISESITVTTADDGTYWLISHVQNNSFSYVYSYQVGDTHINALPAFATQLTNNVNDPSLVLKVSPDRSLIALSRDGVNPIVGTFVNGVIDFTNGPGLVGDISFNAACYGVEFSINNNLYFTRQGSGLIGIDLANQTNEILIDALEPAHAIQRAINGRLYVARKGSPFISEIQVPTNLASPGYNQTFNLPTQYGSEVGLPQWVWLNCEQTLTLVSATDDVNNLSSLFVRHIEREDWINASNVIGFGDNAFQNGVVYHAGNFVDLTPGFDAILTSQFEAYPEGCSDNYVYKSNSGSNANPGDLVNQIKRFVISPNPSKNFIDLTIKNDTFNKIIIASMDGKIVLDKTVDPTSSYNLDISRYASGVYIVNVISNEGKQYSQKLIKN